MDLNTHSVHDDTNRFRPHELEEVLEDPFGLRFLPDHELSASQARYFAIGRTLTGRGLFLCFWTDGKSTRIHAVREMSTAESHFYDRHYASFK